MLVYDIANEDAQFPRKPMPEAESK
jgi:hypothetical protein